MTRALSEALATHPVLVLDGGLASELEARGYDLDDPLWSARLLLDDEAALAGAHRAFAEAGAHVLATATYQASRANLRDRGLSDDDADALMARAVGVAREAIAHMPRPPLVAGSLGSYGACLHDGSEYRGHFGLTRDALREFHRPRIAALARGEPDLLAFETIPSALEAEAIAEALSEAPHLEAWVSFSLRDGNHTAEGQRLRDVADALAGHPQIRAVCVNCCAPSVALDAVRALQASTDLAVGAYPNRGERYREGVGWLAGTGEDVCAGMLALVQAGARLVGGCCRVTPADIASLVGAVSDRERSR